MKCKNCGKDKGEHYIGVTQDRKQMLKNTIFWCYPISKSIKPEDKRYFMKFANCVDHAHHTNCTLNNVKDMEGEE